MQTANMQFEVANAYNMLAILHKDAMTMSAVCHCNVVMIMLLCAIMLAINAIMLAINAIMLAIIPTVCHYAAIGGVSSKLVSPLTTINAGISACILCIFAMYIWVGNFAGEPRIKF